jgi:hypothetical protein
LPDGREKEGKVYDSNGMCKLAALISWSILLSSVAVACGDQGKRAPPPADAQQLPSGLQIERYANFDDAQRSAGYPIPRSTDYPLRWDAVYLQPNAMSPDAPIARAIFIGPRDTSFFLDVIPPQVWPNGPPSGGLRPDTIGGWQGVVIADEPSRIEFAFVCGDKAGDLIWCVVNAPELTRDELAQFLETLR